MNESRTQRQLGVADNGMTSEQLAPSVFRVYSACMGEAGDWAQADPFTWDRITTKAIRVIDENIEAETRGSWKEMAITMCGFGRSLPPEEAWLKTGEKEHLAWEAVARHLVNCLDSEPGAVNVADLEPRIIQWCQRKQASIN